MLDHPRRVGACLNNLPWVMFFVRPLNMELTINSAIEFHDSKVMSIVDHNGTILLDIIAYVHQSHGRPGVDPGTGWTQSVRLTFLNATISGTLVAFPDTILDGLLTLSDEQSLKCFDVPLTHFGPTDLQLEFANEISLTIHGCGIQAVCLGTPIFVEEFNP